MRRMANTRTGAEKVRAFCSLLLLLIAAVLCLSFPGEAYASKEPEKRVFDDAGLFSEREAARLEAEAAKFRSKTGSDMAVLTIDDAKGLETKEYADDFYVEAGLGSRTGDDGVLCVLDMDNRVYYVYTYGIMIQYLTDKRIEKILDSAYPHMKSGEYAAAAESMVRRIAEDVESGIGKGWYTYDPQTGEVSYYRKHSITWYEFLAAFGLALVIAALPCLSVVKQYRMEKERGQAKNYYKAYRGGSAFALQVNEEQFINRTVTRRRIQSSPGPGGRGPGSGDSSAGRSTLHRSNSGRTHGGGGRGF